MIRDRALAVALVLAAVGAGCSGGVDEPGQATTTTGDEAPAPEPEPEPKSEVDWMQVLEDEGAAYLEYVDRIEDGPTVYLHMNRGDHREDEILIGQEGETDRGVAMQLCFGMQGTGYDGQLVVHDPLGGILVDTNPMENSLVLDGAPGCRRR